MKAEIFNLGFATLANCFGHIANTIGQLNIIEVQKIYWQDLKDIEDEKFTAGVAWCRHHCKYFPSIAELGASCFNGDQNWHEHIVDNKRRLAQRKLKKLKPPMSEEKRRENQGKLIALVEDGLAKPAQPKASPEERKAVLREQAEKLAGGGEL